MKHMKELENMKEKYEHNYCARRMHALENIVRTLDLHSLMPQLLVDWLSMTGPNGMDIISRKVIIIQ